MVIAIEEKPKLAVPEARPIKTYPCFIRDYDSKRHLPESQFVPLIDDLTISVIDITPALAKVMLQYNIDNRPVTSNHMLRIAKEMREGLFVFNGDAIRFSSEQKLIDGQHRLLACCETGVTFTSVVIEAINQDAFKTIDSGRKREPGDVLSISGFENCKIVAAAVRIIALVKSGNGTVSSVKLTNGEVLAMAEKMNGIVESAHFAAKIKSIHISGSATCALHYLFSKIDPAKAEEFFVKLKKGENLTGNNPILMLRNVLEFNRSSTRRYPVETAIALTIKAWNYYRSGKEIKGLRYRDEEAFPKIDDLEIA